MTAPEIQTLASPDGAFVYAMWATGTGTKGTCMVICLAPETGDAQNPGQTFAICREMATKLGYATVAVAFLFANKSYDSAGHQTGPAAIGPANDTTLAEIAGQAELIIGAWGDFPRIKPRVYEVMNLLGAHDLYAIQTNSNGSPAHPLAWRKKAPKMYRAKVQNRMPSAG